MCWFNRHSPVRRTAQWNGKTYVGVCRHCGASIRRRAHRDWVRDRGEAADQSAVGDEAQG
jgi:hypothetical protein